MSRKQPSAPATSADRLIARAPTVAECLTIVNRPNRPGLSAPAVKERSEARKRQARDGLAYHAHCLFERGAKLKAVIAWARAECGNLRADEAERIARDVKAGRIKATETEPETDLQDSGPGPGWRPGWLVDACRQFGRTWTMDSAPAEFTVDSVRVWANAANHEARETWDHEPGQDETTVNVGAIRKLRRHLQLLRKIAESQDVSKEPTGEPAAIIEAIDVLLGARRTVALEVVPEPGAVCGGLGGVLPGALTQSVRLQGNNREHPVYVCPVPDPKKPKHASGAPVKYPGLKEFVDKLRAENPRLTWKDVFKRCKASDQFSELPADAVALAEYCRSRNNLPG